MAGRSRTANHDASRKTVERRRIVKRIAALLGAGCVGGVLALCSHTSTNPGSALTQPIGPPLSTSLPRVPAVSPYDLPTPSPSIAAEPSTSDLQISFGGVEADADASIGLVVVPVGQAQPTLRLGDWSAVDPAWSTIKVPLGIAATRRQTSDAEVVDAAITRSDNAAAEQLWSDLGEPGQAARSVEAILEEFGDFTHVESTRKRPEFSAFGQTLWPLTAQAAFLSSATCDPGDTEVFDLMGRVVPDQGWGLGTLPGARYKGGWGPSPDGAYLVRQIGIVDTPTGRSAVAMSAHPASRSFDDGTTALTAVASWLERHVADLPSGRCD